MVRIPSDTTLLVIDVQRAIDDPKWGPRNNPDAEQLLEHDAGLGDRGVHPGSPR